MLGHRGSARATLAPRFALALLVAGVFGLAGCGAAAPADAAPQSSQSSSPPDFELSTLDGKSVRLSEELGKQVILLDFWATFCEPCLRAMPHLDALYEKYRARGFLVLGISIDAADSLSEVRAEVSKLGIRFPILLDQDTRVVALYNPKTSAPFSVLIDREGRIRVKREGYTTGAGETLEADIERALSLKP